MSYMTTGVSNQIPTVVVMLSIIIVVGLVGNLLVVIVYSLKHDKLNATLFILVLALSDLLCCLTTIPMTVYFEYIEWEIRSEFLCKAYYLFNNSFIPFSSLLITCIAFDRYFCLCHPFKRILTLTRAKRLIVIVVLLAVLIGISSTFTVKLWKPEALANQTAKYECTEVIKLNTTQVEKLVYIIVQKTQLGSYILCIASVVILYILIYRSVSKVYKKRKQLKGTNNQIHRHTSLDRPTALDEQNPRTSTPIIQRDNPINGIKTNLSPAVLPLAEPSRTMKEQLHVPNRKTQSPNNTRIENEPVSMCNNNSSTQDEGARSKRSLKHARDKTTFQNLKTASMLFVVAVLYIVTFLPAMLMASELLPLYLPIFYLYYVNNAINPVVYGFMNPNFRQDIKNLFLKL